VNVLVTLVAPGCGPFELAHQGPLSRAAPARTLPRLDSDAPTPPRLPSRAYRVAAFAMIAVGVGAGALRIWGPDEGSPSRGFTAGSGRGAQPRHPGRCRARVRRAGRGHGGRRVDRSSVGRDLGSVRQGVHLHERGDCALRPRLRRRGASTAAPKQADRTHFPGASLIASPASRPSGPGPLLTVGGR
jgi:hypothetical protein